MARGIQSRHMPSPSFYTTPDVRVLVSAPDVADTDVLAVPIFSDDAEDGLADVPAGLAPELALLRAAAGPKGSAFETVWARSAPGAARHVLLVSAGKMADAGPVLARRLGTVAALAARGRACGRVAVVLRGALMPETCAGPCAEGLVLGAFHVDAYKTTDRKLVPLTHVAVVVSAGAADTIAAAVDAGRIVGEATNVARALAHEPPNVLTPAVLAERAAALFAGTSVAVDVLDEQRLAALGMGLLRGVAQGSRQTPRMIVLTYTPSGQPATGPMLGLVGKAVTFDTGGISIKPAENMDRMKYDMAGGAAVIGAMHALARLGAPVRVVGVVPAVENMPGGAAFRPGDVLTGASGTTVEITNTDAEGRLILADALWYAQELGATHLVDVATLTGAIAVALGRVASGLFAAPDGWRDAVSDAGQRGGDVLWPMPLSEDYRELLRSDIADMVNAAGTRYGGAISAALFLKAFTGDKPWAHLDIAGTAWADDPKPWQPKGPTGVAVRTLVELARSAGAWV
jgi:leucyl aminopeptidase